MRIRIYDSICLHGDPGDGILRRAATLRLPAAAPGRGTHAGLRSRLLQQKIQQQQQMQQGLSKVQAQKDQETMSKFDLNGNSKIDANEKPAWDKYWREVKLGKQPHPYDSITQADVTKAANPQTSKTAAKKK